MSYDAKVLTTAEAECLPEHGDEDGGMPGVVLVDREDLLATTRALETAQTALMDVHDALHRECSGNADLPGEIRALRTRVEKAEAELDSARFARDRYANTIGLIESAIGFSGANPVEETIERVRRLKAERDEARTTMRRWESEQDQTMLGVIRQRDEARAEVARRDALAVSTELMTRTQIDQIRAESKTLVAELVTALEGLFVEYDYLCSEDSKYALKLGRVPDHACAECVPGRPIVEPGFRCREHAARATLAKAKGATNGSR